MSLQSGIEKILVLGSGALKIGEAGEFDYSGSQALKALREEGIQTVLINPNIATVQTSEGIADTVYFLPVTPAFVEEVIRKEKPQGIMLAFGGQTALNCGVELYGSGVLEREQVQVLGTPVEAIRATEDRDLFVRKLKEIDVKTARSQAVSSVSEALASASEIGYPVIVRAAYALGGLGSGFATNDKELEALCDHAFAYSSQALIEESLKGWKEIEYEVVRDQYDNCITVCNMENVDPLGIHTGESIVVAPSQTLSNDEYHFLRQLAIKIIRHIGVIGECNVQYALDPKSLDYRVIEVNARLSRSSALASKATGYPLAFIAAKLGLGYGLHELKNTVTKSTTAFFEPSLDYVVCKIPRWDMGKFSGVSKEIGSSMKSVGEVMAIGRTFEEAIQKGIRMIGQGMHGFVGNNDLHFDDVEAALCNPTDMRLYAIQKAMEKGYGIDSIHRLTMIDTWFLEKLWNIFQIKTLLSKHHNLEGISETLLKEAKLRGFSDFQIVRLVLQSEGGEIEENMRKLRKIRQSKGIIPYVKQIDTLAAEYPAHTNYLYLSYAASEHDVEMVNDNNAVVVLGSGAYRIGSSVEFDWCGVNSLQTIAQEGLRSIMINYNPETVSTDYDVCHRLYFDELSLERVLDIIELEKPKGTVVSTGGQIPNNLAMRLHRHGVPILGTSPLSIDRAENRHKFSAMLDSLGIDQPRWKELTSIKDIETFTDAVGFPVLIRPSYVLSGAAMNVVSNKEELVHFLTLATRVSKQYPVVVSEFIEEAKEIEIDAVARQGEVVAYALSEHIEFAGVHSGDATMVLPPQKLYFETIRRIKKISKAIARELNITGPFNMQLLARDNQVKVIECNLRASRSFPFVSKVLHYNFIELATRVMLGKEVEKPAPSMFEIEHIGIKAPQFSFSRLAKADPVLGVEMASTGEVGCLGDSYYEAVLKAMLSVGYKIPKKNILLSTGPMRSKVELINACKMLTEKKYQLFATRGTANFLELNGIAATPLHWPDEQAKPNVLDYLRSNLIDLVINIPKDHTRNELYNDYTIRRNAIDFNIPLITNARLASAFIYAFCRLQFHDLQVKSWDAYRMK